MANGILSIINERRRFIEKTMNEENIFKLLLIVLLISNNYQGCDCHGKSLWNSLNDVILMALLLGTLDGGASALDGGTTFSQ